MKFLFGLLLCLAVLPIQADELDAPPEFDKWSCFAHGDSGQYYARARAGYRRDEEGRYRWTVLLAVRDDLENAAKDCGKWVKRQKKLYIDRQKKQTEKEKQKKL